MALSGLLIHALTEQQAVEYIMSCLDVAKGGWVVTPNLDILRRYDLNPEFRRLIEPVDVVLADGMPLIWASRIQGLALPERVAGSNLILSLTAAAARAGRRIYLLGGDPGTAAEAGRVLSDRNPGLIVAGHESPPVGFERDPAILRSITRGVVAARPDIVFVALGCPKQEKLIAKIRHHLPNTWWLGVGISFSFVAGRVRRAPKFIQHMGLEWAHRLLQEPRRLSRRYLIDGLPFAVRLFCRAAHERIAARWSTTAALKNHWKREHAHRSAFSGYEAASEVVHERRVLAPDQTHHPPRKNEAAMQNSPSARRAARI